MDSALIPAIDVHAHFGVYGCEGELKTRLLSGDAGVVARRAALANTQLTVVSPLAAFFPGGGQDLVAANERAMRVVAGTAGLLHWVVVDPLRPQTFQQAEEMLRHPRCVGMKIHPELHGYPIAEHGRAIFEFAAKHRAAVISHSGESRSMPADFLPWADAFPEASLIMAHLGFCWDGDVTRQVGAIQRSAHGNIYTDTSSSQSVLSSLLEWAVGEIGADHILYGTDTPLYFAPMQRARIDKAEIRDEEKRAILRGNALRLLRIEERV